MTVALPRTRKEIIADRISDAVIRHGHPDRIPQWRVDHLTRIMDREHDIEASFAEASITDPQWQRDQQKIREQIEAQSMDRARRREAEKELADYIEQVAAAHPTDASFMKLREIVIRMRNCRQHGTIGVKPGGGHVVVWDDKCDLVRLCPDESREETKRMADRYVPEILRWQREKPGIRRIYSAVLTDHNYRPGQLEAGKRHLFERFKSEILQAKYQACPVEFHRIPPRARTGSTFEAVRPDRRRTMPKFPQIQGAMVVQEDPLSSRGDWNVHLNVLLLVEGPFSYQELRQEWGRDLHVQQLRGDEDELRASVVECVKYAAQAVPTKSAEKKAEGATEAPAMVEWPYVRWIEWWRAQQGFRRSRTYGVLHGVPDAPTVPMEDVEWIGTIQYDGSCYRASVVPPRQSERVTSIPGDNSGSSGPPPGPEPPPGGRSRPPGYH